jgi:predicted dehydrogenase
MNPLGVAIIGTGLQAKRRAQAIKSNPNAKLLVVHGRNKMSGALFSSEYECQFTEDYKEAISRPDVDIVIVCTPPNTHLLFTVYALNNKKHVLCEKPVTRFPYEAKDILEASITNNMVFMCGFNHRYHPAIIDAKRYVNSSKIGAPLFARCIYGICGRENYHEEWRADPNQAAGGQFIEQGNHAIDLIRYFLGEVHQIACMTSNNFFHKQELDETAQAILRMKNNSIASIHTTLTQWINLFNFEVFYQSGYFKIEGLGGSYGTEKLTIGKREFNGPFEYTTKEYRGKDVSWENQWNDFLNCIIKKTSPISLPADGLATLEIALAGYESNKLDKFIEINSQGL